MLATKVVDDVGRIGIDTHRQSARAAVDKSDLTIAHRLAEDLGNEFNLEVGCGPQVAADPGYDRKLGRLDDQIGRVVDRGAHPQPESAAAGRNPRQAIEIVLEDQPRGVGWGIINHALRKIECVIGRPHRLFGQQQLIETWVLSRPVGGQASGRIILDKQLVVVEVDQNLIATLLQDAVNPDHRLGHEGFDLRSEPQFEINPLSSAHAAAGDQKFTILVSQSDDATPGIIEPVDVDSITIVGKGFGKPHDHFIVPRFTERHRTGNDLHIVRRVEHAVQTTPRDLNPLESRRGNLLILVKTKRQHARRGVKVRALNDQLTLVGLDANQLRASQQLSRLERFQKALPLLIPGCLLRQPIRTDKTRGFGDERRGVFSLTRGHRPNLPGDVAPAGSPLAGATVRWL